MLEDKKTKDNLEEGLKEISNQLYVECSKCEGTGRPRTKTGEPAKTGNNVKCKECMGTGKQVMSRIDAIEKNLGDIRRNIAKVKSDLNAYMDRQTAEFMVIEQDNKWGDYTGVFYLDSEDEKELVLNKARKHFEKYFEDNVFHRNKKLGLFLTSGRSGKRLIEEMETN